MGHTAEAERSIHFSYEMVALSHATARELGYELSPEDEKKPFVEVSGARGWASRPTICSICSRTRPREEVQRRNPELAGR